MRAEGMPLRVVKRTALNGGRAAAYRLVAVALALAVGGLFIWALGHNPAKVYATLFNGALGSDSARRETVKLAIPLLITSLGVTLAFKMRYWNIGAEGQISMGATAATYFALFHSDWPQPTLLVVMALAGFVAGGLWGTLPGVLKARFGTNETLLTLMLNYVATFFIQYLRIGPWKDPGGSYPKIAMFEKSARLPMALGVHIGWIVALVLAALVYLYLRRAKQGYELAVVGENENTARYAGMSVRRIIVRTAFLSAAVCGLAGMLQASGAERTLSETVAGGAGFTAIAVAWLSNLHPVGIIMVSLLFGCLEKGSRTISSLFSISTSAAELLKGIILFFVLGSEFFVNYRLVWGKGGAADGL